MHFTVGIDAGSAAVKALALGCDRPVVWLQEVTSADVAAQCRRLFARLLEAEALGGSRPEAVCATGYGRGLVKGADRRVSEILASALGAGWMWRNWARLGSLSTGFGGPPSPDAVPARFRTILDIGGQDSKVITFTADGLVDQFAMNDRCAAGTGRFLEVMSRVLGKDLAAMDALALPVCSPARINSACTVFAESEVVSLLSKGAPIGEVAAGIYQAVAERVVGLAKQVGWHGPVMLAGGPAHSMALRQALGRALGSEVAVPPCAEFTTALGAALFASSPGGAAAQT